VNARLLTSLSLIGVAALAQPGLSPREARTRQEGAAAISDILADRGVPSALRRLHYLHQEDFAAEEIEHRIGGADVARRRILAEALADLAAKRSERCLIALTQDLDGAVRMAAVQGLAHIHSRAMGVAVALLKDPTYGVRREAASLLGGLGEPKAGKALMAAAQVEEEPEVRTVLLAAVGQSGDREQRKPLEAFLRSSSESTRLAAARALCLLNLPSGYAFAKERLSSKERNDRQDGVLLLEGVKSRRAEALLSPLLLDEDRRLAALAARVLYESGNKDMADWLVLASAHAEGREKLIYEDEIDQIHLTDDERRAIKDRAGIP
jgi:HEAT repeat protein